MDELQNVEKLDPDKFPNIDRELQEYDTSRSSRNHSGTKFSLDEM